MAKKRGRKTVYIVYGNQEVKDILNGKEVGVSFDKSTGSYYSMLPQKTGRTKRQWLGGNMGQAVIKFFAIVSELKGQGHKFVKTPVHFHRGRTLKTFIPKSEELQKIEPVSDLVPENHYIDWLLNELQNPQELAKKTGMEGFSGFFKQVIRKPIKLQDIYDFYTNSKKYKKITDKDESKKIKSSWNIFLATIDKTLLDDITLEDIKRFETVLSKKNLADKTMNHYKSRVLKVFRYNFKNYEDTTSLQRVISYFEKWEELEIDGVNTISANAISYEDFMKLYLNASVELKAVLMFCLNTGTYIREVARIKKTDIDFKNQTLMTKRNKTGKCRKYAFLWDRTINDLTAYLKGRKDTTDILFIARHGAEYKFGEGLRTKFWDLRKQTKLIHIKFEHLRDTFETIGKEQHISDYHIDMVMGHSSGKTSERYTHRRIHNELKESCLKVEQAFFEEEEKPPIRMQLLHPLPPY